MNRSEWYVLATGVGFGAMLVLASRLGVVASLLAIGCTFGGISIGMRMRRGGP